VRNSAKSYEVSFQQEAETLIASLRPSWRNAKHCQQWQNSLSSYAQPLLEMPVAQISTADVLSVLQPIWQTKAETASGLRGRIEAVLDAAKAHGLRDGENPARWRGHLDKLLPKRRRLTRGHHKALAFEDVPAFVEKLRAADTVSARALEFLILTA